MARPLHAVLAATIPLLSAAIHLPRGAGTAAAAHMWPCKNGNLLRTGVSSHLAPMDLGTPIWEWAVPGHTATAGHIEATPLIDRSSNVYIGTTTGGVFALSRNGTQLWARQEPGRIATGALDGDSLYAGVSSGLAVSLDLATGRENWRTQYSPSAGSDAWSVTVANGTAVFVGSSGGQLTDMGGNDQLVALDTADGSEKWRYQSPKLIYNFMPAVVGGNLFFIDLNGRMYCLSLADGSVQWASKGDFSGFTTAGVAVGSTGMAYTNFNTNGTEGGILRAYDLETGAVRWSRDLGLEASAAPAVGKMGPGGPVAVVVGLGHNVGFWKEAEEEAKAELRAFDAETGADLWTFQTPSQMLHGSAGLYSTPGEDSVPDTWSTAAIGGDGTLYAGWEGGKQFALDGATGRLISSYGTGYGTQGGPAIGDGFVVIPTIGKAVAFAMA